MLLTMWSTDKQYQHHLWACSKCKFSYPPQAYWIHIFNLTRFPQVIHMQIKFEKHWSTSVVLKVWSSISSISIICEFVKKMKFISPTPGLLYFLTSSPSGSYAHYTLRMNHCPRSLNSDFILSIFYVLTPPTTCSFFTPAKKITFLTHCITESLKRFIY